MLRVVKFFYLPTTAGTFLYTRNATKAMTLLFIPSYSYGRIPLVKVVTDRGLHTDSRSTELDQSYRPLPSLAFSRASPIELFLINNPFPRFSISFQPGKSIDTVGLPRDY